MQAMFKRRREAADYIQQRGLPCSPNTLAKLASIGGGPAYQRFGKAAVYTAANLDAYIEKKLSAPRASATQ
jgi:hypothetical protein